MNEDLEKLKKVIYNAIGSKHFETECKHRVFADESGCPFGEHLREIRLSDVLVAMALKTRYEKTVLMMDIKGTIAYSDAEHSLIMKWALLNDNLENQSPECIKFLSELLTK